MVKTLYQIFVFCTLFRPVYGQDINAIAGNGTAGFCGDSGQATLACLNNQWQISTDKKGNLYIGDRTNNRIRKVTASGMIVTIAGNGSGGFAGDNGPAFNALPYAPSIFFQPGTAQGCGGGGNGGGNNPNVQRINSLKSNLQTPLGNSSTELSESFHRNMLGYKIIKNDTNVVGYMSDQYLSNFFTSSANTNYRRMADVLDEINIGNVIAAQANVNAIQPTDAIEHDFKAVETIALYKMTDSTYNFTSADSLALSLIASKCVFEGGIAVSQARALLAAITQAPVYYNDNCISFSGSAQRTIEQVEINLSESDLITLYPNPNSGTFTIWVKSSKKQLEIEIMNLFGEQVLNRSLALENSDPIKIENLTEGIYFIKLTLDGIHAKTQRIIVTK